MSRSRPSNDAVNPTEKFFQWAGGDDGGYLVWYNKETKENVRFDLPFVFIVLDRLSTVTGFSDALQSGFWSNEVRRTQTDKLVVRTKKGIAFEGLYKQGVLPQGAKYAQSVYIAFKDEKGELHLGNIKFAGAGLSPWIDFTKKTNVMNPEVAVAITGFTDGKKGKVSYRMPVFKAVQVDEATNAAATKLDDMLQNYLDGYLTRDPSASGPVNVDKMLGNDDDIMNVPLEDLNAEEPAAASQPDQPAIDLDSLKF